MFVQYCQHFQVLNGFVTDFPLDISTLGGRILEVVIRQIRELNNNVHNLAFDVAFLPLKQQITSVPHLEVGIGKVLKMHL